MAINPLAIAQLATTLYGAVAGNKANKKALSQQEQQYQTQLQIQKEQQAIAREMMQLGIATQIDARGNVTAYDKATNTWKTVLAPTQQRIQNLSDREQIQQLNIDAPVNRAESLINAIARQREGSTANTALAQLQNQLARPTSGSAIASSLRRSREDAVNKGFDSVSSAALTQALRSGGSAGAITSSLAKARSQAIASTMGSPDIEGLQLAEDINANKLASLGNLYNALAARASGGGGATFNPVSIASNADAATAAAMQRQQNTATLAGQLFGSSGNAVRGIPDYAGGSDAALFGSLTNLIGALPVTGLLDTWTKSRKKAPAGNAGYDSSGMAF